MRRLVIRFLLVVAAPLLAAAPAFAQNNSGGGFSGTGQEFNFDFGDLGLGDIFSSFFGGSTGSSQRQSRGRDVENAD